MESSESFSLLHQTADILFSNYDSLKFVVRFSKRDGLISKQHRTLHGNPETGMHFSDSCLLNDCSKVCWANAPGRYEGNLLARLPRKRVQKRKPFRSEGCPSGGEYSI